MKDDRLYLIHIIECIDRIEQYVKDDRDSFMESTLIQDGVLRNLQTLGESAKRVSEELKSANPEIDWRGISAFRNVLVHDYLGIKVDLVWQVVHKNIPQLRQEIEPILKRLENRS